MTTNNTELCKRLRTISSCPGWDEAREAANVIESQAARIQQQALDYVSLQAQCDEHLARIEELEKERDALKVDAEGYRLIRAGRVYVEPQDSDGRVYVATSERGRYCKTAYAFDAEIAAALQAEKEAR